MRKRIAGEGTSEIDCVEERMERRKEEDSKREVKEKKD